MNEDEGPITLPSSASDTGAAVESRGAIIRNPIAGRPMLTRAQAIDAISLISATLVADDRHRAILENPRVFNGG
jgi:hypothetical protein